MNSEELRKKSESALGEELLAMRREQFNIRMQLAGGEYKQTHRPRQLRRSIARVKTLLAEKAAQHG